MKRSVSIFVIGSLLSGLTLPLSLQAQTPTYISNSLTNSFRFQTNLKQGQTLDPDVKNLQILLDIDARTRVAETGPGSLSNPTSYFGPKTKDAVMRFQELYRAEILLPANLTAPTGFVGVLTRNKLNTLLDNAEKAIQAADAQKLTNPQVSTTSTQQQNTTTQISSSTITTSYSTSTENTQYTTQETSSYRYVLQSNGIRTTNVNQTNNTGSNSNLSSGSNTTQSSSNQNSSDDNDDNSGALTAAGAVVGVAGIAALLGSSGSSAGSTGNIDYFGGSITNVTYCTCSVSIMLDIQDKVTNNSLSVLYTPGVSTLHANYNVFSPGPNVIGGYYQGASVQCQIYVGESCESQGSPRGTIDTIRGIGTSLY